MTPTFIIVDLFCGAGGTTTGFEMTNGIAKVIACVNHDHKAIQSHWKNHPHVVHFEEDIRTLKMRQVVKVVNEFRRKYPKAKVVLWASLECTNYSKAKGGQARDGDSRTLALHLFRYRKAINPDYIEIENVVEFMAWGPLKAKMFRTVEGYDYCQFEYKKIQEAVIDKDGLFALNRDGSCHFVEVFKPVFLGVPDSMKNGQDWNRWCNTMKVSGGYSDSWRQMNSADYGAYTSRNRLFGCFAKKGLPIVWPMPTHAKNPTPTLELFGSPLQKWNPVKHHLDFDDEGNSIFDRKKPLVNKTLEVIHDGIIKAIKENESGILFKYYGNGTNLNSLNEPAGTITTKDRFAKLQFIFRQYKSGYTTSIEAPLGAIPTNPKAALISFIMNLSHGGHTTSINKPCPVIIARQDKAPLYLIIAAMNKYGIVDIKMRMLKIKELLPIQGFPKDYILVGNQTLQKKFIGNSVEPNVVKSWALSMAAEIENQHVIKLKKAA